MPGRHFFPQLLDQDRPTLWPHSGPERTLPDELEQQLTLAAQAATGAPAAAIALLEDTTDLARRSGDSQVVARTLHRAASLARLAGRADRAYAYALEAQLLFEQGDDRWRATQMMLVRGEAYLEIGEYARGKKAALEAADRCRLTDDRSQLARSLAQAALAESLLGESDAALNRMKEAASVAASCRDSALNIALNHIKARILLRQAQQRELAGDTRGAADARADAVAVLPDIDALAPSKLADDAPTILETAAIAALSRGDRSRCARAVRWMARLARENADPVLRGSAWCLLAQASPAPAYLRRIACARRAVVLLKSRAALPKQIGILMMLADALETAGDWRAAYEAQDQACRLQARQFQESIAHRADVLALDQLADQRLRETERTLAYAQRLSNVGHLVASVNHEVNQPMASIRMSMETALALVSAGERQEALDILRQSSKLGARLTDLTAQLAAFPVRTGAQLGRVSLRHAISESLALLGSRLSQAPCEISVAFEDHHVWAHEGHLVRVIANLVNNALDVMELGQARRILFDCQVTGNRVSLSVQDNGPGLSPAVESRLFEPFFTTKVAGRGLGLGLAMARDVLREMDGSISGHNAVDGGARFTIELPTAPQPAAPEVDSTHATARPQL
ncbi:ATP-binding protein [Paucibacter sp. PLA-PC-4]|uniref:sensor histidine kinase n=1 Tax=Paucibacter sp. PLA-PC-4 TaxID=2993655 RepID=UPI00224AB5FE|nr:ATP-binding protein [Paucibacter sp. PLA-PC-4]MCX2865573.1 ATP-binding protein [Paucibacter sp. PLA-PC-4]